MPNPLATLRDMHLRARAPERTTAKRKLDPVDLARRAKALLDAKKITPVQFANIINRLRKVPR